MQTIKLTNLQLSHLHQLLNDYLLQTIPESLPEKLIYAHLDDINERVRSKARMGGKNLSLDKKQACAFAIWQPLLADRWKDRYPYEYNVTVIIISQIKP